MTAERPDFQSDSTKEHVVKLNSDLQEIMRDDAQDILPSDTLSAMPTLALELETELAIPSDGTITPPPTIGGKTPEEIGKLIQEHFDTVTPEQFVANNRRWNPHLFTGEDPQIEEAK